MLEKMKISQLSNSHVNQIEQKVSNFIKHIKKYLPKCNRMLSRFKVTHSRWLSQAIIITLDEELADPSPSKMGRPTRSYTQALTGTLSTQCCPICGVKPKKLLETIDFHSEVFKPRPATLKYGVSPLHAWI